MSGYYDLYETPCPDSQKENRGVVLHARPVNSKTYTLDDAIRRISEKCTLSPGDVKATLSELTDYIVTNLRDGNRVQLEGLGNFSISLKCKPTTDYKDVRSQDVSFQRINFLPSVSLTDRLKTIRLLRNPESRRKRQLTKEQRMKLLNNKLEKELFVTTPMYRSMTGLSVYAVKKELTELVSEGVLICNTSQRVRFYYKKGTILR